MPKSRTGGVVYIDKERFKDVFLSTLEERNIKSLDLHKWILNINYDYFATVFTPTRMDQPVNKLYFERVCSWLGVSPIDFIVPEPSIAEPTQNATPTHQNSGFTQESADAVATALTGIYNKLAELLAEQKTTNVILREILKNQKDVRSCVKISSDNTDQIKQTVNASNSDIHKSKEHLAQIFTELKYNK